MKPSAAASKPAERDAQPAWRSEKQQREEQWKLGFARWRQERGLSDDTKVFVICPPGGYTDVREALRERGWVENEQPESEFFHFKYTIRAKDLKRPPPLEQQQLNHFFKGGALTTKTGLTSHMKGLRWWDDLHQDDIFPRSYNLENTDDRKAWEIDFRWTAAEAILRRVQLDGGLHPAGVCPGEEGAVDIALTVARAKLAHLQHLVEGESDEDVGWAPPLPQSMGEAEWAKLLGCSYFDVNVAETMVTDEGVAVEDGGDDDDDEDYVDQDEDQDPLLGEPFEEATGAEGACEGEGAASCGVSSMGSNGNEGEVPSGKEDAEQDGPQQADTGSDRPVETQAARQARFAGIPAIPLSAKKTAEVNALLAALSDRHRQYRTDGCSNIWILKPGGKSRGRGIRCVNKLCDVTRLMESMDKRRQRMSRKNNTAWIAMKYVENPLIIHRRKFDIRQWVLVTDWNPLTCYFYDECYLRFAAEDYSLEDFRNRFGHLTNNSIACKSVQFEEGEMGEGNMWDSGEFERWLEEEHGTGGAAFANRIQPAMQRCVLGSLAAVQQTVEHRKGTHELYGYDFIIDEDLRTWLIEVNCSPTLAHSTPVTQRLVTSMVEDLMKVVVDLPEARRAARRGEFNPSEFDTGRWRCISGACGAMSKQPHIIGVPLQLQGRKMKIRRRRPAALPAPPPKDESVVFVTAGVRGPPTTTDMAEHDPGGDEGTTAAVDGAGCGSPRQRSTDADQCSSTASASQKKPTIVAREAVVASEEVVAEGRCPSHGDDDDSIACPIGRSDVGGEVIDDGTEDNKRLPRRFLKPRVSTHWFQDPSRAKGGAMMNEVPLRRQGTRMSEGRRKKEVSELRAKASSAFGVFAIDENEWESRQEAPAVQWHHLHHRSAGYEDDDGSGDASILDDEPTTKKSSSSHVFFESPFISTGGRVSSPPPMAKDFSRTDRNKGSPQKSRCHIDDASEGATRQSDSIPRPTKRRDTSGGRGDAISPSNKHHTTTSIMDSPSSLPAAESSYQLTFSELVRLRGGPDPPPRSESFGGAAAAPSICPTNESSASMAKAQNRPARHTTAAAASHPASPDPRSPTDNTEASPRRHLKGHSYGGDGVSSPRRISPYASPHSSDEWTRVSPRAVLPSLSSDHPSSPSAAAPEPNCMTTEKSRLLSPEVSARSVAGAALGEQEASTYYRRGSSSQQVRSTALSGDESKSSGRGLMLSSLAKQTVASMKRFNLQSNGEQSRGRRGIGGNAFRPHAGLRKSRHQSHASSSSQQSHLTGRSDTLETFFMRHSGGCAQLSSSTVAELRDSKAHLGPLDIAAQRALMLSEVKASSNLHRQRFNLSPNRGRATSPSPVNRLKERD